MLATFRSWWQKAKKPLEIVAVFVGCLVIIALLVLIILVYIFKVSVPGLSGKNLWDWLQLLIIPVVLVVGGFLLNNATSRTEREIALDKQREDALQAYIDSMSELLLHEKLRESGEDDAVRNIARVRTITVLPRLDGERKRNVIAFLYESGLIVKVKAVIVLFGADLRKAGLDFARLENTDLSHTDLSEADLSEANLIGADLREAVLVNADLSGADLSRANLCDTLVDIEQLNKAKSLEGTIMPDGTIHD